jgi:predicted outer membrane repeat protein
MNSGNVSNCNFTNNTANYGVAVYVSSAGNVTNCNFAGNTATSYGGAVYIDGIGNVTNCNFTDNTASIYGGAVYLSRTGNVTNCNFAGNNANYGGAVNIGFGNVTNCNFTRNIAGQWGGAIYIGSGNVTNCNFAGNNATYNGGAIYLVSGTMSNCNFVNNHADSGGAIFSLKEFSTADACIFKTNSGENVNTVIYPPTLNVDNLTTVYGSGEKLTFDLKTNSSIPVTNGNISISVYFKGNNSWVGNYSCLSGEGWIPDLLVGSYYAIFNTEYAKFQPINRTITVNKIQTQVVGNAVTATYKVNKYLVITLKDDKGNPINDAKLTVDLGGAKTYTTDKNGQVKVSTKGLAPKTYTAKVTFNGNTNYEKSAKNVKVTVKKATPKLTAKKKTFKKSVKVKKYSIVLKDNLAKAIKKAKVTIKVGKKTYTAKTNAKGKATFKIKKLTKKGTYKATITYKGNAYYNKVTKKVKIKLK